ncbi:retention module-containing protein, partial [Pseudomonas sp. zbq_18]|uniref:retention module-containing protein n=1 Tax=Pseudomonas sp. zbq_18 TaxID=3367251 RepID=UPI00370B4596
MATLIGVVSQVVGEVFAVAGDGTRRPLVEGDRVYAGEQLVTGASGAVAIALSNGQTLTLGRDSSMGLNEQMLAGTDASNTAAAQDQAPPAPSDADLTDIEQLQAAIEAGVDPTLEAEATAAGPGAGGAGGAGGVGGGHSFVLLSEIGGALDPTIGFPTAGLSTAPQFPDGEPIVFPDEVVPNFTPVIEVEYEDATGTIATGPAIVDEEGLANGTNPASNAEQAFGTLVINSPDGVSAIEIQDANGVWINVTSGGVVQGLYGTLTVDAAGNWVYTLTSNTLNHSNPNATGAGDQVGESFLVRMFDLDGDVSPTVSLDVLVNDDGPSLSLAVNAEAAAEALQVELDETVGGADRYAANDADDSYSSDDVPGALAQATTAVAGGLAALFSIGGSFGADGAGSTVGVFSFAGVPQAGLATNLSSTAGGAIALFLEGGILVGRDANGGDPVLTIEIINIGTPNAPVYQLQTTLFEALEHDINSDVFDETVNLLITDGGSLALQYAVTRTDGDGDSVSQTQSIVLADGEISSFSFDDDGPTLAVRADVSREELLALQVNVDETEGEERLAVGEIDSDGNTDDAGPGLGQVTTNLSGGLVSLFAIASSSYGSDGPGSTTGSFSFTGFPDSGELATTLMAIDGGSISLERVSDTLLRGLDEDSQTVFTIEIVDVGTPGNPVYQLQTTLYEPLVHGNNALHDEAVSLLLAENGAVQLQYSVTVEDADGDTVTRSATVDLISRSSDGEEVIQDSVFSFDDDGP